MNNPITVYCDKDLVFKYVKEMPKEPPVNCLFNSVCCSPFPLPDRKDKDEFALGFARYMENEAWEADYREQRTLSKEEHLEIYKGKIKVGE